MISTNLDGGDTLQAMGSGRSLTGEPMNDPWWRNMTYLIILLRLYRHKNQV